MIVFFYEKVRLKRGVWQTVSIVLLIAFLCAFFTLFDGFICQKEQDMESAYAVIPVTVVVSNLTGTKTDDLKITDYIINYFLSDKYAYGGELQEKAFSSYVKDVCLKASVYYSQGTGFSSRQNLIGITSVDAASELAPVSGNSITYFEGYDESIFTSNKAVCLVSTAAAEELSQDTDNSGNVILTVQMSPAATGEASTQISLEIAGTYSSKSQTIYCPFSCVAAVQTELDGKITGDIRRDMSDVFGWRSYWNNSHPGCPRDCHPICHGRSTLFCYECRGNYSLLDGNWKKRNPITTGG